MKILLKRLILSHTISLVLLLSGCAGASTFVLDIPNADQLNTDIIVSKIDMASTNAMSFNGRLGRTFENAFDKIDAFHLSESLVKTINKNKIGNAFFEDSNEYKKSQKSFQVKMNIKNHILANNKGGATEIHYDLFLGDGSKVFENSFSVGFLPSKMSEENFSFIKDTINKAIVFRIITEITSFVNKKNIQIAQNYNEANFFKTIIEALSGFPSSISNEECTHWREKEKSKSSGASVEKECDGWQTFTKDNINWVSYVKK